MRKEASIVLEPYDEISGPQCAAVGDPSKSERHEEETATGLECNKTHSDDNLKISESIGKEKEESNLQEACVLDVATQETRVSLNAKQDQQLVTSNDFESSWAAYGNVDSFEGIRFPKDSKLSLDTRDDVPRQQYDNDEEGEEENTADEGEDWTESTSIDSSLSFDTQKHFSTCHRPENVLHDPIDTTLSSDDSNRIATAKASNKQFFVDDPSPVLEPLSIQDPKDFVASRSSKTCQDVHLQMWDSEPAIEAIYFYNEEDNDELSEDISSLESRQLCEQQLDCGQQTLASSGFVDDRQREISDSHEDDSKNESNIECMASCSSKPPMTDLSMKEELKRIRRLGLKNVVQPRRQVRKSLPYRGRPGDGDILDGHLPLPEIVIRPHDDELSESSLNFLFRCGPCNDSLSSGSTFHNN